MKKMIAAALAAFALAVSPAFAEHYFDHAGTSSPDNLLWRPVQSFKGNGNGNKKCKATQAAGKIIFDATGGKGGGAAYVGAWRTDWTDSFSVEFTCDMNVTEAPKKNSHAAVAGVNFGFDDEWRYDEDEGVRTGIQVQIAETVEGRSLQIISNKNGKDYDESAALPISAGEHRIEVAWIAAPESESVTVLVFLDGSDDPVLSLEDAHWAFRNRTWDGIVTALFAYSEGKQKFTAAFDDFAYWGDDFTDDSDEDWCDDDGHSDDTGGRGQGRGADGDGIGASAPHASLGNCIVALNTAIAAYPGQAVIRAQVEAGAGALLVALQETGTTVRWVSVNLTSQAVAQMGIHEADFEELSAFGVLAGMTMAGETAMINAVATSAGSQVYTLELREQEDHARWVVLLVRPDGGVIERTFAAD